MNFNKSRILKRILRVIIVILFAEFDLNSLIAQQPIQLHPISAVEAILSKFDTFSIVALGMSHRLQDEADFSLTLIRDPWFASKIKNVVIECGNSLYQKTLDRYIDGEDVPLEQIQLVWRNTTQPGAGDARQHKELLEAVRDVNSHLPKKERIRVLAGDPPIDWDKVKNAEDYAPFITKRDSSFASVVIDQVLAKHEKALLVIGLGHVLRRPISWPNQSIASGAPTVTMLLESRYPHSTYIIAPHDDFGSRNAELEPILVDWTSPSIADIRDTWLGRLPAGIIYEGKIRRVGSDPSKIETPFPGIMLQDLVDGYLYLGPIASIKRVEFITEKNTPYSIELERRRTLLGGKFVPTPVPANK